MSNQDHKKDALGMMGERLVVNYLQSIGHKVEMSIDKFDSDKDLIVDDVLLCEVKTQQPWHMENSFSIQANQWRKCSSADMLIFVETPSYENGNKIVIWDFTEGRENVTTKKTRDNRTMYLYNKKYGTPVQTLSSDEYVKMANKYSVSEWKRKK